MSSSRGAWCSRACSARFGWGGRCSDEGDLLSGSLKDHQEYREEGSAPGSGRLVISRPWEAEDTKQ